MMLSTQRMSSAKPKLTQNIDRNSRQKNHPGQRAWTMARNTCPSYDKPINSKACLREDRVYQKSEGIFRKNLAQPHKFPSDNEQGHIRKGLCMV
jgi:hypothetical protein